MTLDSCNNQMNNRKIKILFVDDEPFILSGLKRMLRKEQSIWDMKFLNSPFEAIDAIVNEYFDIIVSDMRMPGMNGLVLISKVAEISPGTARVVLSGEADEDSLNQVMKITDTILSKPHHPEDLKNELRRIANQIIMAPL